MDKGNLESRCSLPSPIENYHAKLYKKEKIGTLFLHFTNFTVKKILMFSSWSYWIKKCIIKDFASSILEKYSDFWHFMKQKKGNLRDHNKPLKYYYTPGLPKFKKKEFSAFKKGIIHSRKKGQPQWVWIQIKPITSSQARVQPSSCVLQL